MLIRGGRVVDPSQSIDEIRDVLVVDGVLAEVARASIHRRALARSRRRDS